MSTLRTAEKVVDGLLELAGVEDDVTAAQRKTAIDRVYRLLREREDEEAMNATQIH